MEAYKTICPDCGHVRFWVGYKTGLGKTPEQLEKMWKDDITYVKCGSTNAKTEADRESETGKIFDEMDKEVVGIIKNIIEGKLGGLYE